MLAMKIEQVSGRLSASYVGNLLKGGGALDAKSEKSAPSAWIPEGVWLNVLALSRTVPVAQLRCHLAIKITNRGSKTQDVAAYSAQGSGKALIPSPVPPLELQHLRGRKHALPHEHAMYAGRQSRARRRATFACADGVPMQPAAALGRPERRVAQHHLQSREEPAPCSSAIDSGVRPL